MRLTLRLPAAARNPISLLGMAIATAMAMLFLILLALALLGYVANPYIGLVLFVLLPVLLVCGLLLIPLGVWRTRRRLHGADTPPDWPIIDLRDSHQRTVVVAVLALTIVNVVILSLATFGGVHYMESTQFCGQTCHTTMEPEAVAHAVWPHAQVKCTGCHVGPGARAFVESKLAGTRQLFQVMTNRVPRPVPPPDYLIQTTNVTCGQCHSGPMRQSDEIRVARDFADDEKNGESVTTLRMRLGAIHRHIAMEVEYPAADEGKETISYVRARSADGTVREFKTEGESGAGGGPLRRMDCLDCHNRPAHTLFYTPQRAVDTAIADGRIPRDLPFVRREAVAAVTAEYADRQSALDAIAKKLTEFYASRPGVERDLVERATAGVQNVWAQNVFPAMNVKWGTYPNHIGHVDTPGCFRCHDDGHKAADGMVIRQDCELCHLIE